MPSSAMRKVSLRSLAAHKLRLLLTVFAVLLGTSFVSAALIFTATASTAFNSIFDNIGRGVAVNVTPDDPRSGVPNVVVDELTANKGELGIDRIQPEITGPVTIAQADGGALQTGGAPSEGTAFVPAGEALNPDDFRLTDGAPPQQVPEGQPVQVVLNKSAADKAGLKVGSKTQLVPGRGNVQPIEVEVVGVGELPAATGGYVGVQFTQEEAVRLFTDGQSVSAVNMSAAAGVSDTELRGRVETFLKQSAQQRSEDGRPDEKYRVRTGEQVRDDMKAEVNTFLTVFQYILLAFAAIGLVVGTFIIFNTFSMIVAQRNRELALLRAIGASKQNILLSVLLEALVVGAIGGGLGLVLGIGVAWILREFTAGQGMPEASLQVGVAPILGSIFIGVVITVVSALVPAWRASNIAPVEAMRSSDIEPGAGSLRVRTIIGAVIIAVGIALLAGSWFIEGAVSFLPIAFAAVLLIIGVVMCAPAIARPVIGGAGALLQRPFGAVGTLARTNSTRNPRRSAATAFALTLGLTLVVVIGTLGWSLKGEINKTVDDSLRADFVVTTQAGLPGGIRDVVVEKATDAQSVAAINGLMAKDVTSGRDLDAGAVIGAPIEDMAVLKIVQGDPDLRGMRMMVAQSEADARGWKLGDEVTLETPIGRSTVTVSGIYVDNQMPVPIMVGQEPYDQLVPEAMRVTFLLLVKAKPGADQNALRTQLEDAVKPYLTAQVQDRDQFKGAIGSTIDGLLATLYALLGLSLVIAVLGIINTLALSVVERKREIGMLRAVGTARSQIRRMIYLESTYIAVFGALLGVVLGLVIAIPLVHALRYYGMSVLVIPWSLIGWTLLGSAVVGVFAALWPAVRAARTNPLEAISEG